MSNVQPLVVETLQGHIAVAHNGELYNAKALKDKVSVSITISKFLPNFDELFKSSLKLLKQTFEHEFYFCLNVQITSFCSDFFSINLLKKKALYRAVPFIMLSLPVVSIRNGLVYSIGTALQRNYRKTSVWEPEVIVVHLKPCYN